MNFQKLVLGAGALGLVACSSPGEDGGSDAAGVSSQPTESIAGAYAETDLLVSGEWLAARIDSAGVVVLHVASDRRGYDRGHVPGAHFLPLSGITTAHGGITNELPPVAHLDSVFESVGVTNDTRVIVYGAPLHAARAFFTLDYLGLGHRAALLDGGLEGWVAENRRLSTEAPRAVRASLTPQPQPDRVVDASWVNEHRQDPGVALVDARPAAQFVGEVPGEGVPRPGHIPGAGNLFWEETIRSVDLPALRNPDSLRAMLSAAGVEPGDTVVAYCRTGMQASFAYFVARYLGYETKMYDGSFMDWSQRAELPVAQ